MMKDLLISQFIDDELDLDEKTMLVRHVRDDREFAEEIIEFLKMEQRLRHPFPAPEKIPMRPSPSSKRGVGWMPMLRIAAAIIVVVAVALIWTDKRTHPPLQVQAPSPISQRFVIYLPKADTVEIAGTFTRWDRIPLQRVGSSGYWEINLDLYPGEHRFSYIVGGDRTIADPTIATREKDDFGGINSVIVAGDRV